MDTLGLAMQIPQDLQPLTPQVIAIGVAIVTGLVQLAKFLLGLIRVGGIGLPSDLTGPIIGAGIGVVYALVTGQSVELGLGLGGGSSQLFKILNFIVGAFLKKGK